MMIIALANSKGGVGKSTIAVHLTVWWRDCGAKVGLVDADAQGSSSCWLREAAPDTAVFRLATLDDILDQIPRLAAEFDHLVVDGPAGLSEVTRGILFVADLAMLPCGPSVLDLRAGNDVIRVLKQAQMVRKGPPRAVLVPNKLQVAVEGIISITVRLPASLPLQLLRASVERKLRREHPFTQQDIVAAALQQWLTQNAEGD